MQEVLLVIHLLVAIAMIAVVLLQRSEGGALGIGGGGGGGGMFSPRGAGNILTKTTVALAAAFFVTSITLTLINRESGRPGSIIDSVQPGAQQGEGGDQTGGDGSVLPSLPDTGNSGEPQVPVSE